MSCPNPSRVAARHLAVSGEERKLAKLHDTLRPLLQQNIRQGNAMREFYKEANDVLESIGFLVYPDPGTDPQTLAKLLQQQVLGADWDMAKYHAERILQIVELIREAGRLAMRVH